MLLLWAWRPQRSPARFTVASFLATYWNVGLLVTVFLASVHCMVRWVALSPGETLQRAIFGAVAVLIGLVGKVMGKLRRNFWIGIRTPWTLASERVWYATHRFAGRSMVGAAVLSLAVVVCGGPLALAPIVVVAGVLAPALYSLWVYRKLADTGRLEA